MNALLEPKETQSQGVSNLDWQYEHSRHTIGITGEARILFKEKVFLYKESYYTGMKEFYDNIKMERTTLSSPKEEIPLEQLRSDVSSLRADVSEIKADLRYIRESLKPMPDMSKDIAVLTNEVKHTNKNFDGLVNWVRGIGIGFILLLIGYFINNILPLITNLPQ